MEEVSEEKEACERGVPHSVCPWLFSAPALLRVEQVGGGLEEEEGRRTRGLAVPGFWGPGRSPLNLLLPACLPGWLSCRS